MLKTGLPFLLFRPNLLAYEFNPTNNRAIDSPGKITSHHAVKFSLAANISVPQLVIPAGNPMPRKESPVSVRMADAKP